MKKNKNIFIIFGIFLIVLCNSIVYGALNTDMFIDGDAYVRVDRNIRVTGIKVLEQAGGSYETYNCDYSKDTTSIQATLPSSDSFIVYEVTITNKSDIDYEVSNIVEESYSNSNIKYEIIDLEKGTVVDGETTYTFKIKLTTTENDSENKGTLVLKYTFEEWTPFLYNMVAHKSRSLDTDVDFGVAPTKETSGVYEMESTKDDEYPVYYYRGIIDNNNVNFAGFCWKAVRTTSTGGVKLIYNGVPSSDGSCDNTGEASQIGTSAFNTSYNNSKYVGYTYDENTDSTMKKYIDDWYLDNMVKYTNMLEDTVWCSDRSISVADTDSNDIIYMTHNRLYSCNPSLVCVNENDRYTVSSDKGNGLLKYPVALLTSDEAILAGHGKKGYTANGYLNTGNKWWTLSPSNYSFNNKNVYEFSVFSGGYVDFNAPVQYLASVRPSVSLANGTMISQGNGSVSNPYKLIEDKTQTEWTFDYTGGEQEFKVPYDGVYKLEVWGSQGGNSNKSETYRGGYGAYSTGIIELHRNQRLYINIGEQGKQNNVPSNILEGGYNGGGSGRTYNITGNGAAASDTSVGSGGGATHIATKAGLLSTLSDSVSDVLIVAGGGGGGCWHNYQNSGKGGEAGGIKGGDTIGAAGFNWDGHGGTQNERSCIVDSTTGCSAFGLGGGEAGGGGGSGYYGGSAGRFTGGGGGSSYIGNPLLTSKLMYCYECQESSEESTKTISTTSVSEEPVSNYAKKGNGYVKITLIEKK